MSTIESSTSIESAFRKDLTKLLKRHGATLLQSTASDEIVGVYIESRFDLFHEDGEVACGFASPRRVSFPVYFAIGGQCDECDE